ncbi:MAG: hypothetical protein KDH88_11975 [Chromatiales bacterium]|nr:hypothetical protein [Chromatiales bacterium]
MMPGLRNLSIALWMLLVAALAVAFFSPDPELAIGAALFPFFVIALLWRPGEPPVLVFALLVQWVQVVTGLFLAGIRGLEVVASIGLPAADQAIAYALSGLCVEAIGIRLALAGMFPPAVHSSQARSEAAVLSPAWMAAVYLLFTLSGLGVITLFQGTGLNTLAVGLVDLKWALFFVFGYTVLEQRRGYALLFAVLGLELLLGFSAYFSEFKTVLFVLAVLLATRVQRQRLVHWFGFALILGALVYLLVVWSAVKQDYRAFLNQGSGEQVVLPDRAARLDYLSRLVSGLSARDLERGLEILLERVSYVDFFAHSLQYVPLVRPHEDGRYWGSVLTHILTPRLLFPDKPALDDSDITYRYTGVPVAGKEQGTSASIGYMAENYIDFGWPGMLLPVFLMGLVYGVLYRWLLAGAPWKLARFGLATALLLRLAYFELSIHKIFGGLIVAGVLTVVALYLAAPLLHPRESRGR